MTDRPKLQLVSVALLSLACVAFSVCPMADTGFPAWLWHLTPFFAVGLLFGAGMATWRAVAVVVGMRLLADFGIWAVTGKADWAFYGWGQLWTYAGLMTLPLIGRLVDPKRAATVVGGAVAGPVAFFLVSNFGVWLGDPVRSLGQVYYDGLPFLRNSLAATPLYALGLFHPAVLPRLCGDGASERAVA